MAMYPVEFFTTYHSVSTEPEWSRSERLGYCEPFEAEKSSTMEEIRRFFFNLFG